MTSLHLACLLATVSCAAPRVALGEVEATELENVRMAVGYAALQDSRGAWKVTGSCAELGLEGTYELVFDKSGSFHHSIQTPLGEALGFDGETVWTADETGLARVVSLGGRNAALGRMALETFRWLTPGAFHIEVDHDSGNESSVAYALFADEDKGELLATVLVSRATWLPIELHVPKTSGVQRYLLLDWREAHGLHYPHRIEIPRRNRSSSEFVVQSITLADGAAFTMPAAAPGDTQFAKKASQLRTRLTPAGHTLVQARLGARAPGWFLLDSGAGAMLIDRGIADGLGLERRGEILVVGVGGSLPAAFRTGAPLHAGAVTIEGLNYIELDLAFLEAICGVPVEGVIGYDLFARTVVVMERSKRVELHDPASFELTEAAWTPFVFEDETPCVEASFPKKNTAWFKLDTGSDDTVAFHGPATRRYGLLRSGTSRAATQEGVGGSLEGRRGTLDWFRLGEERFTRPPVTFHLAESGAFGSTTTAGNIGSGMLGAFRVVFDYSRRRVAFQQGP